MHGRNDADVPGDGQQAGGPCHRLENPAVEVRLPSEAKPARDRQHEIDARFIKHSGQAQIIFPATRPAIRVLRNRQPARAIGSEGAELEGIPLRSEEHTSELQSLMRSSYAVFCLKNKNNK